MRHKGIPYIFCVLVFQSPKFQSVLPYGQPIELQIILRQAYQMTPK